MKRILALCTSVALALGLGIGGATAASATQPDTICPSGNGWVKTDLSGPEVTTLTATAPAGKLIAEVCYKAANEQDTFLVDPAAASVQITSTVTNKNGQVQAISHYSVRLVDAPVTPEKPADKVTYGNWVMGEYGCEDTQVTETREVTTITFELVNNVWVEKAPVVTTETRTRALTQDELKECPPPTYDPTCTTVTGTATIAGDGVISVPGDWVSKSIAVPFTGKLADIGTVLNIEATPLQYVGLHIDTAEGTIVFEEEPSYAGKLWSTSAWAGVEAGMGYAAFGSIEEFIELNGDVVVTGIRLLYTHPEASSTTVTSFTIGCTTYTFKPAPAPVKGSDVVTDKDCETLTVTTTTTPWVQSYVKVNNEWVLGEKVYGEADVDTRDMTEAEELECAGDKPEPLTRFQDRLVTDCEADFVATWRTYFKTEFVLENGEWVKGEEVQVGIEEQVSWRAATDVECPPVKPEQPKTPVTPQKAPPSLAVTGSSDAIPALGGAALLALLGGLFLARRKQSTEV